ncbi:MAG: TolB family protein, partial [Bacteroidota bacterium]
MSKAVMIFFLSFLWVFAATSSNNNKVVVSQWMKTSPQLLETPVFANTENVMGETFSEASLLEQTFLSLEDHFPQPGKTLMVRNGNTITWNEAFTDSNGYITLEAITDANKPQVSYLAVYITASRWMEATLEIKTPHMLRAWLNGKVIGTKKTTEKEEKTVGKVTKELKMNRGKHLLILKTIKGSDAPLDWKIRANLELKEPYQVHDLGFSPDPLREKNIHDVLEGKKISSVDISPDGNYYIINYSQIVSATGKTERWPEIKSTEDQKVIHSFRHADVSRINWTPESNKLSYTTTKNGKTSLYLHDIQNGVVEQLMEDMENFTGYQWAPDENYIIYSLQEKGKGTDDDIRQIIGMADRQPHFRNRSFLYKFDLNSNTHQRITYGNLSSYLQDIHPESEQILFSQSYPDYTEIPYSRQNMFILNLNSMQLDTLWVDQLYSLNAKFSPEGDQLLCTGGPSAFDGIGENVAEGTIPNNYDTQAYIYDLSTQNVTPFTKTFDPSVSSATWNKS